MEIYGTHLPSRMILGTAQYPSPAILERAVRAAGVEMVTVSVRRESAGSRHGERFWAMIRDMGVAVLPNTAGCRTVKEAVTTAHMAAELFDTPRIKLETVGDDETLQPDPFALVEAAEILGREGFEVWPYTTEDAVVAGRLLEVGCQVLMPWGAPIGSARGLNNLYALTLLRSRFPDVPIIIDAGLGVPSHAAQVLELGFDGVLLNTAVAKAGDPVAMAEAFRAGVDAGRRAYEAGPMSPRDLAQPSTPVVGQPFWHGS